MELMEILVLENLYKIVVPIFGFLFFFYLFLYIPVNSFSVISGQAFLG